MRATPGSLPWLVARQVRWQWLALTGRQRWALTVLAVMVLIFTFVAYAALQDFLPVLRRSGTLQPSLYPLLALGEGVVLTLMVSSAVNGTLEALFTRGDLDLLLHSPIAPRTVLGSRALGVAFSALGSVAIFLLPIMLVLLIFGVWRGGLGLGLWWLGAALIAASIGLWLTLGLVRWLGVRRTRTVASVIGALIGASVFLVSQWPNMRSRPSQDAPGSGAAMESWLPGHGWWPEIEHPLWFPVRAVWAEPGPLLLWLVLAGAVFALTVQALTQQFTEGVRQAGEAGPVRRPTSERPLRFRGGRTATLLKEWRLVWRDPELLSRTLLQLVYLLPMIVPFGKGNVGGLLGAGVVMLTVSLASNLANITLNAEDAPDLLVCAPRSPAALRREKWLAAVLPVAALGGLALLVIALRGQLAASLLQGWSLLPVLLVGIGGAALLVLWTPLPVRRADAFKSGRSTSLLNSVLTFVFQICLSVAAFSFSVGTTWGLYLLIPALLVLVFGYASRRSDVQ